MEAMSIAGRRIGPADPPYIIAEIGANHNGDVDLCLRLIEAARECGADAVKFQSWSRDSLISRAEYQRNVQYARDPQAPTLEEAVLQYQLTPGHHREIARYCRANQVVFFSSCFAAESQAIAIRRTWERLRSCSASQGDPLPCRRVLTSTNTRFDPSPTTRSSSP